MPSHRCSELAAVMLSSDNQLGDEFVVNDFAGKKDPRCGSNR